LRDSFFLFLRRRDLLAPDLLELLDELELLELVLLELLLLLLLLDDDRFRRFFLLAIGCRAVTSMSRRKNWFRSSLTAGECEGFDLDVDLLVIIATWVK